MTDELTDAQIEELRQMLLEIRDSLTEQLAGDNDRAQPVKLDQQSVGRVSRIDAIQQQEMAKANTQQLHLRLRLVSMSLAASSAGDYGYCQGCDEPIAFARLKAKPETPLCLNCQSAKEQL